MKATVEQFGIRKAIEQVAPVTLGKGKRRRTVTKQAALAHRMKVSQQAVSSWVRRGWVPTKRADEIEQLTGVPARELLDPRVVKMLAGKVAA